jgi:hemin uptake protein HemP
MSRISTIFFLFLAFSLSSYGADSAVRVQLDSTKASPRSVESLTEQVILRDYRFAWTSIAQALEFNTLDPLEGAFTGESKQALSQSVTSQQRSGLRQRYVDQNHKVQAVFYAPEGDVIELHDTAEYQLQILDGGKLIHEEHVVMHYIVLMTPAADRWMVRHLQAVPQF